jgi:tetratricopeptide (TPR) repeat protein
MMARQAVDQTLASVDVDPIRSGADVPQMAELRRGLLERAKQFSLRFLEHHPRGVELRDETALAYRRLGDISRMMNDPADAEAEYGKAIAQLQSLEKDHPSAATRARIADIYNWIGETLRTVPSRTADAAAAYERARALQEPIVAADGGNADDRQLLARIYGNRAILRASKPDAGAADLAAAEADFREALRLLEPIASRTPTAAQELSRTANNLAALIAGDGTRAAEAATLYDRAIRTHEGLVASDPGNRVYKLELAQFRENDADLARDSGDLARATRRNQQALALLDELLMPAPSLGIEHADAHDLRGRILAAAQSPDAADAYAESLALFDALERDPAARRLTAFHQRFGDLLLNLAILSRDGGSERSHRLLADAVGKYAAHAETSLAAGDRDDARVAAANLAALLPELGDADRRVLGARIEQLQQRVARPQ